MFLTGKFTNALMLFEAIQPPPLENAHGSDLARQLGVNPSVETVWNWHTFRLMVFFLKCLLLPQDGARLVKRRRALLESNSPRNNQLETHRDDEPGALLGRSPLFLPRSSD